MNRHFEQERNATPHLPVESIWIVDDDPEDFALIRRALSRNSQSLDIRHFLDGEAFLLAWSQDCHQADFALLDINLPKLDGFQTLENALKIAKEKTPPIFLFSSADSQQNIEKSQRLGAAAYYAKPHDFEGYVKTARSMILRCETLRNLST